MIGQLEEFSGKDWDVYVERLEEFMIANDLQEIQAGNNNAQEVTQRNNKRRAILLSAIGSTTYSLLRNLTSPSKPSEKSYTELVAALKEHYAPTPSITVQRFKFQGRFRKHGESIASYVSELRKLAEHCNFGGGLEDRLREQFVCGINDETLQKRLLSKDQLSFDKAYKMALSHEVALRDAEVFKPSAVHTPVSTSVNKVTSSSKKPTIKKSTHRSSSKASSTPTQRSSKTTNPGTSKAKQKRQCYRCGDQDHIAPDCPFQHKECHFCHKIGHVKRVCFAKKRSETVHNVQDYSSTTVTDDIEYETVYKILSVHTNDKPVMRELCINGREMLLQEDSGSGYTLMNVTEFRKKFPDVPLEKSDVKLKTYTGHKISVVGQALVEVIDKGNLFQLPIVVTQDGPMLIGRLWLNAFNIYEQKVNNIINASVYEDIVNEYASLFDLSQVGCMQNFEAKFEVNDANPVFCKARSVSFEIKKKIGKALQDLEAKGIIRKVVHSD